MVHLRLRLNPVKLFTLADMIAIGDSGLAPDVAAVAADYQEQRHPLANGNDRPTCRPTLRRPTMIEVRNWYPTIGQYFTQADFDERQRVVLLGPEAYQELFPNEEYPIDQTVQVNDI